MIIQDLHKSHLWSEVLTLNKFREYSTRSGEAHLLTISTRLVCGAEISARNVRDYMDKTLPLSSLIKQLRETPQFSALEGASGQFFGIS
jgi:hypothetical protein